MSGFLPGNVSRVASTRVPSGSVGERLSWTPGPRFRCKQPRGCGAGD
jgi:hypothetical protein